jgi:hypothetical protein
MAAWGWDNTHIIENLVANFTKFDIFEFGLCSS